MAFEIPKPSATTKVYIQQNGSKIFWREGDILYHAYPKEKKKSVEFLCFHENKDGWISVQKGRNEFLVFVDENVADPSAIFTEFDDALAYHLVAG